MSLIPTDLRTMSPKPPTRAPATSAAKIPIGGSEVNPSDLKGLRDAWQQKRLVVLGAGVSLPYGLPSWRNLVLDLLFEQSQHTDTLGPVWPHYRRALAEWMMDYFDYNPLVLGRMIEQDIEDHPERNEGLSFIKKLRERLYANIKIPASTATALQAIALLVKENTLDRGVSAAVTFNYDDLLEQELAALDVPFTPVIGPLRQHSRGFPVVHPHGYVPTSGKPSRDTLVFTEDDYHKLTDTVFHWSLSELVIYLRKYTVLFIGLSMSDPNLRRLLDACRNSKVPQHWQIQKRHALDNSEMAVVAPSVKRRAKEHGRMLGIKKVKDTRELKGAIRATLQQADEYDQAVFQSMGVETIWIEDWPDLPLLIDSIAH